MAASDAQQFLNELDKKLWTAADRLRSNQDAVVDKHAVLGFVFLKYVSDAFELWRQDVDAQLCNESHDYFFDPAEGELGYRNIPGVCKAATFDEIAEHCFSLTSGRYVEAEEVEDDGVPFAEKMEGSTRVLAAQLHESEKLPAAIRDIMQHLIWGHAA